MRHSFYANDRNAKNGQFNRPGYNQRDFIPYRHNKKRIRKYGKEFDLNTALDYDTTKTVLEILGLVPGAYSKQTRRSAVAT